MANKIDTFVRNPHMTNTADRRGTRKLSYLLLAFPLVNACADTHEIATSPTQSQLEAMNESFRALPTTSTCVRQGVNAGAHCIESMSLPSLQSAGVEVEQSRHQNRVVRWDALDKIVVVATLLRGGVVFGAVGALLGAAVGYMAG